MNNQPKNKILIIIIGILLIANIVTLSLFLMNKGKARQGHGDRRVQITSFLKKEVGFSDNQLMQYDTISKAHRTAMKIIFDDMSANREIILKKLSAQEFNDSAIVPAADAIAEQQKPFELKMLDHIKDIRNICTPAQRAIFDTGFYKIIAKRGEPGKDKQELKQ